MSHRLLLRGRVEAPNPGRAPTPTEPRPQLSPDAGLRFCWTDGLPPTSDSKSGKGHALLGAGAPSAGQSWRTLTRENRDIGVFGVIRAAGHATDVVPEGLQCVHLQGDRA